jgi:hypothetical protein
MSVTICTIVSKNYLGYARALVHSFRQQHPTGRAWVLVVDQPDGCFDPTQEPFDVLFLSDLGLKNHRAWGFRYGPFELCNSLKPVLLNYLLTARGERTVLYLDSDIGVFNPLDDLLTATEQSGLLLTPHCTQDFPTDGYWPNREVILTAGTFNAGVVGVTESPLARSFLKWWTQVLEYDCVVDLAHGIYVDQRYLDLVPTLFAGAFVCRHDGVNVGHFNLHQRQINCAGGRWTSNSDPLLLFHFTQVNWTMRDFWPPVSRPLTAAQPSLRKLIGEYGALLDQCGLATTQTWPNSDARFTDGTSISAATRAEFRRQSKHSPPAQDPFSDPAWIGFEKSNRRRKFLGQIANLPRRAWRAGLRAFRIWR